jgi:hypothetical protein
VHSTTSARATTLNAHYTAPTVIGAMYHAAARFGFKGGRVLEPAFGIGHFVGLMPEDMLRCSTLTGIEIDPLTARIAKALYPDVDIRAQPFASPDFVHGPIAIVESGYPVLAIANEGRALASVLEVINQCRTRGAEGMHQCAGSRRTTRRSRTMRMASSSCS